MLKALSAVKKLKTSQGGPAAAARCPELCNGDGKCSKICEEVRTMICDASGTPKVVAVNSLDGTNAAAAAATAATNAVRDAVKEAIDTAAKAASDAAKEAQ